MSFLGHLEEFRGRLFKMAIMVFVFAVVLFIFRKELTDLIYFSMTKTDFVDLQVVLLAWTSNRFTR